MDGVCGSSLDGIYGMVTPGIGGTIYYRDRTDMATATVVKRGNKSIASAGAKVTQLAFYGMASYTANKAAYQNNVFICTPLTVDNAGNIYFGFRVTGGTPTGLASGIARVAANGSGTWISGTAATGDAGVGTPTMNCAPALSNDQQTVYITVSSIGAGGGYSGTGYLVGLDATTLKTKYSNHLVDPEYGGNTILEDIGSATPMVGPDGDVYIGVLNSQGNNSRGWMLHFNSTLAVAKTPGAFGWDDTPSVVPSQCTFRPTRGRQAI